MKLVLIFIILFTLAGLSAFAQMGVNTDNSAPDPSAGLDVKFTNKGLLPPRVTLNAINTALPVAAPAAGLLVYNTATAGTPPNNVVPGYYCWNGSKWIPVVAPQGTNIGDMLYWNGVQWVGVPAGSNGQVLTFNNGVPAWGELSSRFCGLSLTINHAAGAVAPVSKTVTYGTVTNIPGEPLKCWLTSNLGADHQAASVNDGTEASAGWYWQFNREQGYKHDGSVRIPNTAWTSGFSESADWTADNDPCAIEVGTGWHVPTRTDWINVDASGNWTEWNGPWTSGLRLHAAGGLGNVSGSLGNRGAVCYSWCSSQSDAANGWYLLVSSGTSITDNSTKASGFSVRCVRDN